MKEAGLPGPWRQVKRGRGKREIFLPWFRGRKSDQSCEIWGGEAIGQFPWWDIRNVIKKRAVLRC